MLMENMYVMTDRWSVIPPSDLSLELTRWQPANGELRPMFADVFRRVSIRLLRGGAPTFCQ